jgi:hypothetical protein
LPNNVAPPPPKKAQNANNSQNQQIPINHSLTSNNTIERKKPAVTQSQFL